MWRQISWCDEVTAGVRGDREGRRRTELNIGPPANGVAKRSSSWEKERESGRGWERYSVWQPHARVDSPGTPRRKSEEGAEPMTLFFLPPARMKGCSAVTMAAAAAAAAWLWRLLILRRRTPGCLVTHRSLFPTGGRTGATCDWWTDQRLRLGKKPEERARLLPCTSTKRMQLLSLFFLL